MAGATGIACSARIDACRAAGFEHGGEVIREVRADGGAAIEEGAAASCAFGMDGAGDLVARGEITERVIVGHEGASGAIDQFCAFATQGFGGEWGRVAADIDGGGVELHELGVGDQRACRVGHRHCIALR